MSVEEIYIIRRYFKILGPVRTRPHDNIKIGRDEARINGLGSSRLFVFGKDDGYASNRQRLRNYLESHENGIG